jgi:hypothetical protein
MTKRAPSFDFGMPQERPQEPRGRLPEDHRCQAPGCTAWASYGLREPGVAQMREPCVWFCREHIQNFGTGSS